jgi:hypothetical protein
MDLGRAGWKLSGMKPGSRRNPEKSKRVTDAMLKMQKIIVANLQKAYDA